MDDLETPECSVDDYHELTASDEYHEFQCSTCQREGKNMKAEAYCVECDSFLCQTCLKQHTKFDSMKSHQILKTSENLQCSDKRMNSTLDLPSQRCEVHHGKLVDIFCQDHNEVCCGACAIINHSSCLHKLYIPKVAKDADVMKEAKDAVIEIEKVNHQAKHMCSERRHLFANLKAQKSNLSSQITKSTNKIINHFKTLESNLLSELEDKVTTIEEDVQLDINDTDKVISTLQHENRLLSKHIAEDNISTLFVQLKLAERNRQKCVNTLKHMRASSEKVIELSMNHRAADVADTIKSLGSIVENKTIKTVVLNGDFDVRGRNEKSVCDITDIIQHNDGTTYITDFENRSLKALDSQYRVTNSLCLPGQPNAMCFVGGSSVAIALTDVKLVQFACLTGKMALSSSFSVRDHCRGIAHVSGNIYVTCGGKHKNGEGKGVLCVYTLSGKMLILHDIDLSLPKHIQRHGDFLYIADTYKCLVIMTHDGRVQQRRIFKDIDNLKGICTGPGKQQFLCGYNSNTVILLSENIYQICTIDVDGITKPQALCFDHQKSRLIIALDSSDTIKVLDLVFD